MAKLDQLESNPTEKDHAGQLYRLRGLVDQIVREKRLGKFVPPSGKDYFVVEAYEGIKLLSNIRRACSTDKIGQEQLQSMVLECQDRIAKLLKQHGEPGYLTRIMRTIHSNLLASAFVQLYYFQLIMQVSTNPVNCLVILSV
jgi:hypothetical protein